MKMKSRVVEKAPGETEVTVVSDVNVVGMLAQFGRGMIQDVSDQLFQKFSTGMRRELETSAAPPATAAPAPVQETAAAPAAPKVSEMSAVAATPAPAPPAPAAEAVLDVGALGAAAAGRAAGRMVRRPGFWVAVLAAALALYWFFVR
jgi:hypothetical protein